MHKMLIATAVLCFGCVAAISVMAIPARGGDLEITVEGIIGEEGKVMVALHAESDTEEFPDVEGVIAAQWAKAAPGTLRFVFLDLPPGRFAIAVFHDENDNNELDTNLLGIPSEGTGYSKDAHGSFGPPGFSEAAVEISTDSGITRTSTTLVY